MYIILAIIVVAALYGIMVYNGLVGARHRWRKRQWLGHRRAVEAPGRS